LKQGIAVMRIVAGTALAMLLAFGSCRAEDAIAPERLALAKEVMTLSGGLKVYDDYQKYLDTMIAHLRRTIPSVDEATAGDVKKMAMEEFTACKPEMIEGAAKIYARHFSEEELKALIAFYKTPAGQHLMAELPAVTAESATLVDPFNKRLMGRIQIYMADKIAAQQAAEDKSKDKKDK
jgi:hypothetical protein